MDGGTRLEGFDLVWRRAKEGMDHMGGAIRGRWLALAVVTALTAGVLAAGTAGATPPTVRPRALHVNCAAAPGGNGSVVHPWNTLAQANAFTLTPGDELLVARGSTCTGTLDPQGSGTPGHRVVIGAYGKGPLPRIVGDSADAVVLTNFSYAVVRDLNISNPGTSPGLRRGLHLVAQGTTVTDLLVHNLFIHNVAGNLAKDTGGSGGIQVDALGSSPTGRFDGLVIARNHIVDVARSGIFIAGTQGGNRPLATQPWPEASRHVVVRGNHLDHLAGDGIVATGTAGAVLERNVVIDGNRAGTSFTQPGAICDAGIWAFDANGTIIQYNEVSHMEFNGCDGTGYDVDYDQDNTVVQYNYSHDNAGGFILLCTDAQPRQAVVRYNLSVDDAATLNESPCDVSSGQVGTLDGLRVYNNTFVAPKPQVTLELTPLKSLFGPGDFAFKNNIVDATTQQSTPIPCGNACSNNLFFGLPASGKRAVVANPRFFHPARRGRGRLAVGRAFRVAAHSAAVGAGVAIPGAPGRDYFSDPVPKRRPTIGMDQPRRHRSR